MRVSRCMGCGALSYPVHSVCHSCGGADFKDTNLGQGALLTYTVLHVPPPGVDPPLRIGIVEFEGGVRALGQLTEEMDVGTRVEAEWAVVRRVGDKVYEGFRFRPVG